MTRQENLQPSKPELASSPPDGAADRDNDDDPALTEPGFESGRSGVPLRAEDEVHARPGSSLDTARAEQIDAVLALLGECPPGLGERVERGPQPLLGLLIALQSGE